MATLLNFSSAPSNSVGMPTRMGWGWWKKPLLIAICTSIIIHAIFLLMKWNANDEREKRLKTPLAVVLVNSQSNLEPFKAKRLAQANLNGGGDLQDQIASALTQADPGVAKKLESLQNEQARLLSSLKTKSNNPDLSQYGKAKTSKTESDPFEAELAERLSRQGQMPRKAIFTATSAKSVVYAQYYDAMRKKVEKYGTEFFPRHQQQPLYGNLILLVSVNRFGKLMSKPEIKRSSGNPELDRQAIAIVNASAPFGAFSVTMANQLDVIDWVASFNFIQGQGGTRLELKDGKNDEAKASQQLTKKSK
jgi:protein TonB